MNFNKSLCIFLFSLLAFLPAVAYAQEESGSSVDVKEIVLGHLSDSYDWHLCTWNDKHISIPLPVILYSEHTGFHCFLSSAFHHAENGEHEGFFYNEEANGKIYERIGNGQIKKPWDFSLTKSAVQILIVVIVMLCVFLSAARYYRGRRPEDPAPNGFVGLVEMFTMSIVEDLIRPSVGEAQYKRFTPYLLTCFFFIFITNLLGLLPIFPGGANVTGNINITFFLAICTLLMVNLFGNKEYWKETLWPPVPMWLKCPVPMMPVIELFGIFTKPFALMVRLFANMMGGHAIILSLACVIFITCQLGALIGTTLSVVSVAMMIFMNCLELLVAFIQAYVFTMLSAVFIGLAHPEEHHH